MSLKNGFLPQHLAVSNLKACGNSQHIYLLTRHVRGAVKLSRGAAFFRPIHEVGWLIHVLSKENHGAFQRGGFGDQQINLEKLHLRDRRSCQDTHTGYKPSCWQE